MTENWYLVLELEFDPNPVVDERVIEQKIEEKRKFWSSKANDFNHGAAYRKYSQMLPEIKKDMLGETNIRAELIKDACEKTYGPIDKILKGIRKTEIPADTVEKIAKKQKVAEDIVKRRAAALGIKIVSAQGGNEQAIYDKYYKNKPQNADKFNGMKQWLATFNVDNLYEFLYKDTPMVKSAVNQPCEALRQRAGEKKKKEYYKNDSISGTGSKLCAQCDETFKDDSSKQIYDKYLEYNKRKAILDSAKETFEYTGEIPKEAYQEAIGKLTEIFKDRKLAESVFAAFCKIEKIPVAFGSDSQTSKNTNLKICRCGVMNDISDGRKVCHSCGLELQIKCPKCGSINDNNVNVCKCGFKFENIDKAIALCELAADAMEHMDFSVARAHLGDADKYWPGSDKVKELVTRLKELESRVGKAADEMREACSKKMYFTARKCYENVRKFSPTYEEPALESEINSAIAEAEKYKKLAQTATNENDIVEACTKAYEACHDCPGVKEIIAKYPPMEPTNLRIQADGTAKTNVLAWDKSNTPGLLFYTVVRKEGAVPISVQDGTLIGRVSMCSLNDLKVMPGVQYFYAVFAERAGVFSRGLVSKEPVINLFEISNVQVASGDETLQFSWDGFAQNASVGMERMENGKIVRLTCNNRNSYVDAGLKNDTAYEYRVFLTYTIGAKKLETKGIRVTGMPTRPPQPIEKLIVKPTETGDYFIEWDNPEKSEVQFYCSEKKPEFLYGDIVPVAALEKLMKTLVVQKKGTQNGTFSYAGDNLIYIVAAVIKSGSAVIGTIARASRDSAVKVKNVNLINGKILITTDLPKDVTGFVVLYRDDKFPDDISDTKSVRKYIPLKMHQHDGGLLIDSNEPQNYYFSIFAEFKRDGEKDYSAGTDYLFSNVAKEVITYSVEVVKKLLGGKTLILTFEAQNNSFTLPDIDIMSAQGVAPMFKQSAKLFHQIPGQEANGAVQVKIPLDNKLPKETYIKAFLKEESMQGRYQLKLKIKSDLKIS